MPTTNITKLTGMRDFWVSKIADTEALIHAEPTQELHDYLRTCKLQRDVIDHQIRRVLRSDRFINA